MAGSYIADDRTLICREDDNHKIPFCDLEIFMWRLTFILLGTPILTSSDFSNAVGKC